MKAILMSIKPQYVVKILNGEKTIEIRKKFPKDYVGWVYVYCTKAPLKNCSMNDIALYCMGSGKVVARFWCDKVESFEFCEFSKHKDNRELYNECIRKDNELCKKACISCVQMVQYLDTKAIGKDMFGKAIHITKVEPFDKPKEISEFCKVGCLEKAKHYIETCSLDKLFQKEMPSEFKQYILTRAPQSWCYVEV